MIYKPVAIWLKAEYVTSPKPKPFRVTSDNGENELALPRLWREQWHAQRKLQTLLRSVG